MDKETIVKGGLVVGAIAVAILFLSRGHSAGGAAVYGTTPAQQIQVANLSLQWAQANLQNRLSLTQNATNYLETLNKDSTAIATAKIQGQTAVALGGQALKATSIETTGQEQIAKTQATSQQAIAQIQSTAAQSIAQTQSAAQVTQAQAQAGAQKTSSFWNFLGQAAGAIGAIFG